MSLSFAFLYSQTMRGYERNPATDANIAADGTCSADAEACRGCGTCYVRNGVQAYEADCPECAGTGCSTDAHRGREE